MTPRSDGKRRDERKTHETKPKVKKETVEDLEAKPLEDLRPGEDAGDVKGGARKGRYPGRTAP